MIKVADIYVSDDGCGPYTISVCGGSDASYFKIIGKSLYFDEDQFIITINPTTTNPPTTINPSSINMFFASRPYNSYVYGLSPRFYFDNIRVLVYVDGVLVQNPQLSYQWQEQINNTWTNILNATQESLFYNKLNYVRVIVTHQTKSITSPAVRGFASMP